jgi:hypothetical protein
LLAEITLRNPAQFYAGWQAAAAELHLELPSSPAIAAGVVLDLPLGVAGLLLLDRPAYGAVVAKEGDEPALVLALRVRSGAEVVPFFHADGPSSSPGRLSHELRLLNPGKKPAVGVIDDWLVLSSRVEALESASAYVVRAEPARPLPPEELVVDLPAAALHGPLDGVLRAFWQRAHDALSAAARDARAGAGRPPDFGDPEAILADADGKVSGFLSLLRASERVRLTEATEGARVTFAAEGTPTPGGAAAQAIARLADGPLGALLDLPRETKMAVLLRLTAADFPRSGPPSDGGAPSAGASLSLLPPALRGIEPALAGAAERVLAAGDGTTVLGVLGDRSVVLRRPGVDAAGAEALATLGHAVDRPEVEQGLAPLLGKYKLREHTAPLPGLGTPAFGLTLKGTETNLDLWWTVTNGTLSMAARVDGASALDQLAPKGEGERLAADRELAERLERHGTAAGALFALWPAAPSQGSSGSALAFWGRRAEQARFELSMPRRAALSLARAVAP